MLKAIPQIAQPRRLSALLGPGAVLGLAAVLAACGSGGSGTSFQQSPPAASLSTANLAFAEQTVSTQSAGQLVTITNSGGSALAISSVSATSNFTQTNTCGASLPAGGSCVVTVIFAPALSGPLTGTLTIADNAANGMQAVALAGTGIDATGMVTSASMSCGAGVNGTCYALTITCPNVATFSAQLKVLQPTVAPVGTILLSTSSGGNQYYDVAYNFGALVVSNLTAAGFTTAEVGFTGGTNGWLQGPGGPRALSCRFVSVAQWVYANIHNSNQAAPYCLHGVSGGGGAISYGLAHFGLDTIVAMAEVASGPPFGRVDYGCLCNQGPMSTELTTCPNAQPITPCYQAGPKALLDASYGDSRCTDENQGDASLFYSDSVASADANVNFPKTDVEFIYGGLDTSSAVPLGLDYAMLVQSKHEFKCVPNAPHTIPDNMDGATQISTDLITMCKLQ